MLNRGAGRADVRMSGCPGTFSAGAGVAGSRYLDLRWPGQCVLCCTALDAGTLAWWDAEARKVTCVECCRRLAENDVATARASVGHEPVSRAGGSAQREHDRRK